MKGCGWRFYRRLASAAVNGFMPLKVFSSMFFATSKAAFADGHDVTAAIGTLDPAEGQLGPCPAGVFRRRHTAFRGAFADRLGIPTDTGGDVGIVDRRRCDTDRHADFHYCYEGAGSGRHGRHDCYAISRETRCTGYYALKHPCPCARPSMSNTRASGLSGLHVKIRTPSRDRHD